MSTSLTGYVRLNTIHVIMPNKLEDWNDLAPVSLPLSLWSVITCRTSEEVESVAPSANSTSQQPSQTAGPTVTSPDLKHEAWKVMRPFHKGTPCIRVGMQVIMKEYVKEGGAQYGTIHTREGTVNRVWKREVNWLHFLIDLTMATNTSVAVGGNEVVEDVLSTTRVTLAVPRQLTAFNLSESVHLILNRHTLSDIKTSNRSHCKWEIVR
ncbi:hypothetical protein BKA70DRAFT_1428685 [Coprinopsis sp. MPI-PUGE-AT-0042]|nr:hypothetical protein BKA70DRAFT_1428685 [Coprinopsis sp. MPI-PUGE-AT-0042]